MPAVVEQEPTASQGSGTAVTGPTFATAPAAGNAVIHVILDRGGATQTCAQATPTNGVELVDDPTSAESVHCAVYIHEGDDSRTSWSFTLGVSTNTWHCHAFEVSSLDISTLSAVLAVAYGEANSGATAVTSLNPSTGSPLSQADVWVLDVLVERENDATGGSWTSGTNEQVSNTGGAPTTRMSSTTAYWSRNTDTSAIDDTATFSSALARSFILAFKVGGATQYTITPSGSVTAAGSLGRASQGNLAGSLTPAAAAVRATQKPLAGASTPAGAVATNLVALITPSGSASPSGLLSKLPALTRAGQVTPVGVLLKEAARSILGSSTPAGALTLVQPGSQPDHTALTSGSGASATSFTTASVSPTADALQLLLVDAVFTGTVPVQPTVTGCGLTWVVHSDNQWDTSGTTRRITLFRAQGASPTTGTLTIDFGTETETECNWGLSEFSPVPVGNNGADAIQQTVNEPASPASDTSLTFTFPSAFQTDSVAWSGMAKETPAEPPAVDSEFTEIFGFTGASSEDYFRTCWLQGEPTDGDVDWGPWTTARRRGGFAVEILAGAGGGTQYTITPSGSATPSGLLDRVAAIVRARAVTPAGAVSRATARSWQGTATPAGGPTMQTSITFPASVTPSGVLTTLFSFLRTFTSSVTPAGLLDRLPTFTRTGALTPAGTLTRATARSWQGTATPAGSANVIRALLRDWQGTVTMSGAFTRTVSYFRGLAGTATPSGLLGRLPSIIRSGSLTGSGSVSRATARTVTGSTTPAGAAAVIRALLRTWQGTVTGAGQLVRDTARSWAGSVSSTGVTVVDVVKQLAGQSTPAGTVDVTTGLEVALSGVVTAAGSLARATSRFWQGTVTGAGQLVRDTARSWAGQVAASGSLQTLAVALRQLAASVTPSGAVTLVAARARQLAGSITGAGSLVRDTARSWAGQVGVTGGLEGAASRARSFAGTVTPAGVVATVTGVIVQWWQRAAAAFTRNPAGHTRSPIGFDPVERLSEQPPDWSS